MIIINIIIISLLLLSLLSLLLLSLLLLLFLLYLALTYIIYYLFVLVRVMLLSQYRTTIVVTVKANRNNIAFIITQFQVQLTSNMNEVELCNGNLYALPTMFWTTSHLIKSSPPSATHMR